MLDLQNPLKLTYIIVKKSTKTKLYINQCENYEYAGVGWLINKEIT